MARPRARAERDAARRKTPGSRPARAQRAALSALVVALVAALVAGAAPAARADDASGAPRIYRWIDENGIAHYTTDKDRIPGSLRSRIGLPTPAPLASPDLQANAPTPPPAASQPPPAGPPPTPTAPGAALGKPPPRVAVGGGPDAWAVRDSPPPLPDSPWADPAVKEDPAQLRAAIDELDFRIAELEADIAQDEDALKARISDPKGGGPLGEAESPELKTLALRLPERLEELRSLREERVRLAGGE